MAIRLSTGLRNALLGSADFRSTFNLSRINIYSGTQPTTADAAATGTLLLTITVDGGATGLTFDAPVDGVISKAAAESWQGTTLANGTAGYFRLYAAGDDPAILSTTNERVDGSIAVSGGDMNISSTSLVASAVQTVSQFDITLPAS